MVGQFQVLLSSTLNMVAKMLGLWNCSCQHKEGDIKHFGIKYFLSLYIVRWSEDGNQLLKFKIIWSLQCVTGIIKWSPRGGKRKLEIINLWIWIEEIIEFKLYVKCIHHKIYPPFENSISLKKQKNSQEKFSVSTNAFAWIFLFDSLKSSGQIFCIFIKKFSSVKNEKSLYKKCLFLRFSLVSQTLRIEKKRT